MIAFTYFRTRLIITHGNESVHKNKHEWKWKKDD